jgi:gamma-glutamylcyclotransferase (GGCT)/AIG2-like uncharacterized protein YtfP
VIVLVIGSALRSLGFDQEAVGLTFVEEARTAPKYRLYSLEERWAALVPTEDGGISVAGELVEVSEERWPEIVASEPPGIVPGPIELDDGREVTAALGDPDYMELAAVEISEFGSFQAYIASRS